MQQLISYFLVGGVAAVTDLSLFFFCTQRFGLPYLPVGAVSFLIATYVNYTLSIRFVFHSGSRFQKRHEVSLVFLVSGLGLLVNQATLFCGHEIFSVSLMPAKILATGTVFFWNFGIRRYVIFHKRRDISPISSVMERASQPIARPPLSR